jgi:pimeloyl-ACP methyl ester carboxylesterase
MDDGDLGGAVSHDLPGWQVPCLIFMGAADNDFFEQAQRAAREIPTAEFLSLGDANHYAAHTSQDELLLDAVLRTLRANS